MSALAALASSRTCAGDARMVKDLLRTAATGRNSYTGIAEYTCRRPRLTTTGMPGISISTRPNSGTQRSCSRPRDMCAACDSEHLMNLRHDAKVSDASHCFRGGSRPAHRDQERTASPSTSPLAVPPICGMNRYLPSPPACCIVADGRR